VYNLNAFNGKLLAGVNNKVILYRWSCGMDDDSRQLVSECSHAGHILALHVAVRGEFILVGDLMKSMSLLIYKPEEGIIEERARDPNSTWMTAVEMLDDDTFLGAENAHNLLVVRKNGDAATDEERQRLDIVGEFHLGEFVNRFRRGSLVMRLPDSELAKVPTTLFGTINGVIGVVASLPAEQYAFLARLQDALCATVRGVGGFSWAAWRSFGNERRTADVRNFIDGDLIECVRPGGARCTFPGCALRCLLARQVFPGSKARAHGGGGLARRRVGGGAHKARGGIDALALNPQQLERLAACNGVQLYTAHARAVSCTPAAAACPR
jgi:DNA damage-binding protein 1